jgi:geranylgeranyl pyrophosphate synthase
MKTSGPTPELAMKEMQKVFKKRGTKALRIARKEVLRERIECNEANEALTYFMNQYWNDLARPALLSMVCEAVGGDPEITTPIGVPMILISGAISIHDDIIDKTKAKSGSPTVYGKFGQDIALLVGDALLFKGFSLLNTTSGRDVPVKKIHLISKIVKTMFFELGDAEASELSLRGRMDVSPQTYLQVVSKKAADVEAHTQIGAVLGGGSKQEINDMGHFGRDLGMMIILRDDWIDLMDPQEIRHRIKHESLPLPILYGLQDPQIKASITPFLQHDTLGRKDTQELLQRIHNSKAFENYLNLMNDLSKRASSKLKSSANRGVQELELLVKATLPPSIEP